MDSSPAQTHLFASLQTLKLDLFTNNGDKKPIHYMQQLTNLLDACPPNQLVLPTLLSDKILDCVQHIQAKCLVDQECVDRVAAVGKQFEMVASMPGTLLEESTVDKAMRVPLYEWLIRNRDMPYPKEEEKKELSRKTGMTTAQINHWFVNSRRRNVATRDDLNTLYG
ncbi:hypothetical protein HDU98_008937 [Podochytrium sp. JEL0797]|nr:hypothetical protein HDU98_008937 [Podochytrium sp. JEL0797]